MSAKDFGTEHTNVKMGYPPVVQPIILEKDIFDNPSNVYQLFRHLVETDDTLWGGLHTASVLTQRCLSGFVVKAGKTLDDAEKRLQLELDNLWNSVLHKYSYDIAWKLLMDGNAVYALDKTSGVNQLHWLPMPYLTCVETEESIAKLDYLHGLGVPDKVLKRKTVRMEEVKKWLLMTQVLKRGIYVLNELDDGKRQTWKVEDCAVFDWGRLEEVTDLLGRYTLNVWNKSPLLALRAKILWKHALIIGDMQYRRKYYPREHHKLPSEAFDPDLFEGATYEARLANASAAAKKYLEDYSKSAMASDKEGRQQPDQGYVTFKDVEITIVESKTPYTAPNELVDQIDKAIPAVTGVPQSAISGASSGRASYASELQIGAYLALKAEYAAGQIALTFIDVAKRHIRSKLADTTDEPLKDLKLEDKLYMVDFKLTKILERHQLVRDAAILQELPFTDDEIRAALDYQPLTEDEKKMVDKRRQLTGKRHTESSAEASATSKRKLSPGTKPITPGSQEQQQQT